MNTKKLSICLASLALLLCLIVSTSADSSIIYSDVSKEYWAYNAIMDMTERGMFKGTSEIIDGKATFSPEKTMQRSEFITVLTRYLYSNDLASMPSNSGAWYANNYLVALKYGLLTAEELDNGDLTKPCTRQEMAMLLVRAAYRSNGEVADKLIPTAKIADYADVADEYKSYVVQSYSMGLLVGIDEKGTFNPDGVLNRAQAATAIYRLIDPSTRAVINDDQISFEWKNGITYEGGYKNGEADGYGTMFFPEIGTYTGSFSHGRREGTGTFNWIVGDSYTGMWNNDKMCGEGKYTFADGTVIDGTWNNNRIVLETFYMEPSSLNISINSSASIAAICSPKSITEEITWTSSAPEIVEVYGNKNFANLKAKAIGDAVISATTESGKTAVCVVSVDHGVTTKIALDHGDYSMMTGNILNLKAEISPENTPLSEIAWSSSDTNIAEVNESGTVFAYNPGGAIISAKTPNGLIATCYITVLDESMTLWNGYWNIYKANIRGVKSSQNSCGTCAIDMENMTSSISMSPFSNVYIDLAAEDSHTMVGGYETSIYGYELTFSSITDTKMILEIKKILGSEYYEDTITTEYYVLER